MNYEGLNIFLLPLPLLPMVPTLEALHVERVYALHLPHGTRPSSSLRDVYCKILGQRLPSEVSTSVVVRLNVT